jgi:hypothetical protein
MLEEYFEVGDPRFFDELTRCESPKKLKALAERWFPDSRPFARQAMLRYVEDGCDRPGHRAMVKTLFKLAEAGQDDLLMGRFMVAFDRLIKRKVVEIIGQYDFKTRTTVNDYKLRWNLGKDVLAHMPDGARHFYDPRSTKPKKAHASYGGYSGNPAETPRFTRATRLYLRRRAWRYFRRIGMKDPERYGKGVRAALRQYQDEPLSTIEGVLDSWGLVHALYGKSPVLEKTANGIAVAKGQTLGNLQPSPYFPAAWTGVLEDVLQLIEGAQSHTVRQWAVLWARTQYADALKALPLSRLRILLRSKDEDVQTMAAELLQHAPGVASLSLEDWLSFLKIESPIALPIVCELVKKNVAPSRLSLAQCVALAKLRPAPVAELGFEWAKQKPLQKREDLEAVLKLTSAESPLTRQAAVAWLIELLKSSKLSQPLDLRDLLDSRHADVRVPAVALMDQDARFGDEVGLWSALAETPYQDVRAQLLKRLKAQKGLPPDALRQVWANALLAVHNGGKSKRMVVNQVARRVVAHPTEAEQLVPLLALALRSVRPPERRNALAALAQAAFQLPALRAQVARSIPELKLFVEGV